MALPKAYVGKTNPTVFNIGTVAEISPATYKDTSKYTTVKFKIAPRGSGSEVRGFMTFYPGALQGVRDTQFETMQYGQNVARVLDEKFYKGYNPQINSFDQYCGLAKLQGLCGSEKVFDDISTRIVKAFDAAVDQEEFLEKLDEILSELVGTTVGFITKQQWETTDETYERNGKTYAVKIPGRYNEIAGFFYVTEEVLDTIDDVISQYNSRNTSKDAYPGHKAVKFYSREVPFDGFGTTEN